MSLLVLTAAASFVCAAPTHHDGDAIHCDGMVRSLRLYGIDAPEMPGACRPGRVCTPGDPFAARNYLAGLTRGRRVVCTEMDVDHYGRSVARCTADGDDLAGAMIAAGHAVPRYGNPGCSAATAAVDSGGDPRAPALRPAAATKLPALWGALAGWLVAINLLGWAAMADDKARARLSWRDGSHRIPETALLAIAAFGGSIGVLAARQQLGHKRRQPGFSRRLYRVVAAQLLALAVVIALGQP